MTPEQLHQLTPPTYGGDFELTLNAEAVERIESDEVRHKAHY